MSISKAQESYLSEFNRCLVHIKSQGKALELVSQKIFQSLKAGGVLHVFGSGHSHSFAEELFHRAGGLVPVNAILEDYLMPHAGPKQVGPLERLTGIATAIAGKHEFKNAEVCLLASNSGINAATVELAEILKTKGVFTVGITSLTHSKGVPSRANTKKLYEVVDAVIDTGTPVGDACVEISNSDVKVAPLSGVISLLAGQLIAVRVSEIFAENGMIPPVYQSANTPGGDERNKKLEAQYSARIRHLR